MTGHEPQYVQYKAGVPAFNTDYKAFAPSFGCAWSPNAKSGWLRQIMGGMGQMVFRGGYSIAYNRNGMQDYDLMFSYNPGITINIARNAANGDLVTGSDTWPLLFRDKGRLGPPSFPAAPVYPLKTTSISDQVNVFDPNTRTPYTMSRSFDVQRELTRDMVLEVRYVATRNLQRWVEINLNEQDIVENGLLDEFKLAMTNLQANQTAGRGNNFKYYGPGTGTSPLPISLAYFSGIPKDQAGDPLKYTSTNFASGTYVSDLARTNPNPGSYASSLWTNATQRTNASAAGLPVNFFVVNPHVASGGSWLSTNGSFNLYDSMVVELRHRLSKSLLVQANYVFGKSLDSARSSFQHHSLTLPAMS